MSLWSRKVFFSPPFSEKRNRNRIHSEVTIVYIAVLPQGYVNAFSFCQRNLDLLHLWKNILLAHYADDIMLMEQNKQEMTCVLEILVRQR